MAGSRLASCTGFESIPTGGVAAGSRVVVRGWVCVTWAGRAGCEQVDARGLQHRSSPVGPTDYAGCRDRTNRPPRENGGETVIDWLIPSAGLVLGPTLPDQVNPVGLGRCCNLLRLAEGPIPRPGSPDRLSNKVWRGFQPARGIPVRVFTGWKLVPHDNESLLQPGCQAVRRPEVRGSPR